MVTPLTLYGSHTAAATIATANLLMTSTGAGADLTKTTLIGTASGYGTLRSQGNAGAWPAAGSLPAFNGFGWLWDVTTLEGNTLVGGNFTPSFRLFDTTGLTTVDLYFRVAKVNAGVYTQIGSTFVKSGVVITAVSTIITMTAVSLPTTGFSTGDKLYIQLDANITTPNGSGVTTVTVVMSNSSTLGQANSVQLITQGYTAGGGGGGGGSVVGGFALATTGSGVSNAHYDTFRVTQHPDPSMSLAKMGRVGSSLVSWNVNLPSSATTLGMLVSTDGVNFSDMSQTNGGPLPGIASQQDPWQDTFAVDNSALYTSTLGYSGSVSTWIVDTTNSRLTATAGARGIFLYGPMSCTDIDLLCDMDESDAGGLVWSYSDSADYYSLAAADASASIGTPNRLTLYKTVAGVQTQLAQATIAFTRLTPHRIRATMLSGVISVTFDGIAALSYTDATPLPAGSPGLVQNANSNARYDGRGLLATLDLGLGVSTVARFYQFWAQPQGALLSGNPPGDTVTSTFVYTQEVLNTTDNTVSPQVSDMTIAVFGPQIGAGALIPSASYVNTYNSANMDDLKNKSNYGYNVDKNFALSFLGRTAQPAPWLLVAPDQQIFNLHIENANDAYSNRQILTGVIGTFAVTEPITGNNQAKSFPLSYPIAPNTGPPQIKLNTLPQAVAQKGASGADWYYDVQFKGGTGSIAQDGGNTPLSGTDIGTVSYTAMYITQVQRDNLAGQAALAALEGGGTGIVENVTDVSALNLTVPAANAYGDMLNARYGILGRTVTFDTYRPGLAIGQLLPAFIPASQMNNVQLLITGVDISIRTMRAPGEGAVSRLVYSVTASENANLGSWQKRLASIQGGG